MSSFYFYLTTFFVALNVLFGVLAWTLLRRVPLRPRLVAAACGLWAVTMIGLFFVQFFAPVSSQPALRNWFYFPISVEMTWNLLLLLPAVVGLALLWLALRLFGPRPRGKTPPAPDPSRRRFLYLLACGAAPATALGLGVHGSDIRDDLRVRRYDLPLANLPPELEGFTIAHVSDLHSGIFCGPRRLELIADSTNDLRPDLIALTGDFINHDILELPAALAAMKSMRAPHGLHLCEGNHDVIPGPGLVASTCAAQGLPFLNFTATTIAVRGTRLVLGGLPWLRQYPADPGSISRIFPARQPGDLRVLLVHHPDFFDLAVPSCDLVLSGHTHGGQIMLGDVGFGPLFFKYWSGRYQRGSSTLVVSNGCGDWFPCRIGAPAEIGLLTLRRAG